MMIPLGNGERAVDSQPVYEIGYLADAARRADYRLAVTQEYPVQIPFSFGRQPNQAIKRECLARPDDNAIYFRDGQPSGWSLCCAVAVYLYHPAYG